MCLFCVSGYIPSTSEVKESMKERISVVISKTLEEVRSKFERKTSRGPSSSSNLSKMETSKEKMRSLLSGVKGKFAKTIADINA